jgi:hypothetical protein
MKIALLRHHFPELLEEYPAAREVSALCAFDSSTDGFSRPDYCARSNYSAVGASSKTATFARKYSNDR